MDMVLILCLVVSVISNLALFYTLYNDKKYERRGDGTVWALPEKQFWRRFKKK